jgi:predicted nucleotidyltransferase
MCVTKFQNEIEYNVTLHGSFNNGSFTMDSDIDLVARVPIMNIYNMLSEIMSSYIVINKSENHKMNRLIIFDTYFGFQLDIVEFKDELTRQTCVLKDKIVKKILS